MFFCCLIRSTLFGCSTRVKFHCFRCGLCIFRRLIALIKHTCTYMRMRMFASAYNMSMGVRYLELVLDLSRPHTGLLFPR